MEVTGEHGISVIKSQTRTAHIVALISYRCMREAIKLFIAFPSFGFASSN